MGAQQPTTGAGVLKRILAAFAASTLMAVGLADSTPAAAAKPNPVPGHLVPGDPAAAKTKTLAGTNYWYAGAWDVTSPTANKYYSASGVLTVDNPWTDVAAGDHSLAEVAIWTGSGANRQIVEIGWCAGCTNDRIGDTATRLFVYAWRNGVGSGYNPADFIPYCAEPGTCAVPGDILTGDPTTWTGTSLPGARQFQIQQTDSAWWFAYDGKWIGSIPNTWWTSVGATFTAGSIADFFGEVASDNSPTCTDMGNANLAGAAPASAYFTTVQVNGANPTTFVGHGTDASKYSWAVTQPRSVRYGGPSSC
jgi:neprosin-like protein